MPSAAAKTTTDTTLPSKRSRKIARKFAFTVSLLIVLTMCSYWLISSFNTQNILNRQATDLGNVLAEQTAAQLTELVLANDLISMNVVLGNLTESSAIAAVSVLNVDGNVIASATTNRATPTPFIPLPIQLSSLNVDYLAPINLADSVAGYVRLRLDLTYIEVAMVNNLLLILGATFLIIIVAALLTSTYLQYLVSFPANLLAYSLSNLRSGKIESCPEPKSEGELTAAIRQFNATAEFLAANTYLSKLQEPAADETAESVLQQASREDVTLLAIKLANFHYLASTQDEDALIAVLNNFYFLAGKVSQLYGATVCFCSEGDILVTFDRVPLQEERAFMAVCAGQLFLKLINELPQFEDARHSAKFRLAIHSGSAIKGLYSAISDDSVNLMGGTVDLVWQLSEECPDNALLLSEASLLHAGPGSRVEAEDYIEVGAPDSVKTYLAGDPLEEFALLIERQASQLGSLYAND